MSRDTSEAATFSSQLIEDSVNLGNNDPQIEMEMLYKSTYTDLMTHFAAELEFASLVVT